MDRFDRFDRFFVLREDLRLRRPPFRAFIPLLVDRVDDMRVGLLAGLLLAGGMGGTEVVLAFSGEFRPTAVLSAAPILPNTPILIYIIQRNKRVYLRILRREVFFVRLLLDPPELGTGLFDILTSNLSNRLMIFVSRSLSLARIVE